jgi:hypothetical protein
MNEKHPENAANEKIVDMQEESEEDDEMILKLFVNEKLVSWAKTLLYSFLEDIHLQMWKSVKGMAEDSLST